jgi:predicted HAD superfamily Cof-like phosphohydrolase
MGLDIEEEVTASLISLRRKLIEEETREVVQELDRMEMELVRGKPIPKDMYEALVKELADLQYVLSGTVISMRPISRNFSAVFNRVHQSNMSKLGDDGKPLHREDGKVMKGPNYREPTLEDLIR